METGVDGRWCLMSLGKPTAWAMGVAGLVLLLVSGSPAGATQPECQVVNLPPKKVEYNSNTYVDPLGTAIAEAEAGDTLQVIGTCHGSHTITKDLTIVGRSSDQHNDTIVGDASGSVLFVPPVASFAIHVAVRDLTITGGAGGIYSYRGVLEVSDSRIVGNAGTGIGNFGSAAVSIDNSVISDNVNTTINFGRGGGIYNSLGPGMTINNSTISNNTASGSGGGIFMRQRVTVNDSVIAGNTAALDGGGVYGSGETITGSVIEGNTAGLSGGGVYVSFQATFTDSTVTNNTATTGGGVFAANVANVTLNGTSNLCGNTPDDWPGCTP